jgi:hypothetical protein
MIYHLNNLMMQARRMLVGFIYIYLLHAASFLHGKTMFSEAGWNVYDFFAGKKKTFLPPSSSMQGVVSWAPG